MAHRDDLPPPAPPSRYSSLRNRGNEPSTSAAAPLPTTRASLRPTRIGVSDIHANGVPVPSSSGVRRAETPDDYRNQLPPRSADVSFDQGYAPEYRREQYFDRNHFSRQNPPPQPTVQFERSRPRHQSSRGEATFDRRRAEMAAAGDSLMNGGDQGNHDGLRRTGKRRKSLAQRFTSFAAYLLRRAGGAVSGDRERARSSSRQFNRRSMSRLERDMEESRQLEEMYFGNGKSAEAPARSNGSLTRPRNGSAVRASHSNYNVSGGPRSHTPYTGGLINTHNFCFFIATVQALAHSGLVEVCEMDYMKGEVSPIISTALRSLFTWLKDNEGLYRPNNIEEQIFYIRNAIRTGIFALKTADQQQQDVSELLLTFITRLHAETRLPLHDTTTPTFHEQFDIADRVMLSSRLRESGHSGIDNRCAFYWVSKGNCAHCTAPLAQADTSCILLLSCLPPLQAACKGDESRCTCVAPNLMHELVTVRYVKHAPAITEVRGTRFGENSSLLDAFIEAEKLFGIQPDPIHLLRVRHSPDHGFDRYENKEDMSIGVVTRAMADPRRTDILNHISLVQLRVTKPDDVNIIFLVRDAGETYQYGPYVALVALDNKKVSEIKEDLIRSMPCDVIGNRTYKDIDMFVHNETERQEMMYGDSTMLSNDARARQNVLVSSTLTSVRSTGRPVFLRLYITMRLPRNKSLFGKILGRSGNGSAHSSLRQNVDISSTIVDTLRSKMVNMNRGDPPERASLPDALMEFMLPTCVEWSCGRRGHTLGSHRNTLVLIPPTMIFQIKRFINDKSGRTSRLNYGMQLPMNIDMRPYITNPKTTEDDANYDLVAILCHLGETLLSGHYIVFGRNPADKRWRRFDDNIVTEVTNLEEAYNNCYVVFYERVSELRKREGQAEIEHMELIRKIQGKSTEREEFQRENTAGVNPHVAQTVYGDEDLNAIIRAAEERERQSSMRGRNGKMNGNDPRSPYN